MKYNFIVHLSAQELSDDQMDALYAAGLDDAIIYKDMIGYHINFNRVADSFELAQLSAKKAIQAVLGNNAILSDSRIVCAALRHGDVIACAPRHGSPLMRKQVAAYGFTFAIDWEEGFIDQHCNFLTRKDAMVIAKREGQIHRPDAGNGPELWSEHLY